MTTTNFITLKSQNDVYAKQGAIGAMLEQAQRRSRTNVIKNITIVYVLVGACLNAMNDILSKSYQNGMSAYVDYTDHDYTASYVRSYGMPSVTRISVTVKNSKLVLHITREKLTSIERNNIYVNMNAEQKQKAKEQIFKRFCKERGYSIN